jgi:hypothetical protein
MAFHIVLSRGLISMSLAAKVIKGRVHAIRWLCWPTSSTRLCTFHTGIATEKSRDQADLGFRLGSQRYDFDQAVNRLAGLLRDLR